MEWTKFEITLVSADNLPNIRSFGRMKVYAVVSLNGKSKTSKKTTADMVGETNPRWNFPLDYKINEASVKDAGLDVVVKLYCQRTLGDKYIGEVKIPVKGLFDSRLKAVNELSYTVTGTRDGRLNIRYSFGEMFSAPKPTNWKGPLLVGALVAKGTWFLLTGDTGDWIPLFGDTGDYC